MSEPTFFKDATEFRAWLESNAATATELAVGFHKVDSGRASMTWPESVDEALCFGWIDGVRRRIDEFSYQIRFSPRRASSNWSAINIAKYASLLVQGRITAAGAEAYARRRQDRSEVYSYEQRANAKLSAEESRAFKRDKAAWNFFQATPPGYRKVMLHWITSAKRAQTRASRLERLIEACRRGERIT